MASVKFILKLVSIPAVYTIENYPYDYLHLTPKTYKRLYLKKAHVYMMEIYKGREYVSGVLKITKGRRKACTIQVN
jgi:hypothetical protein